MQFQICKKKSLILDALTAKQPVYVERYVEKKQEREIKKDYKKRTLDCYLHKEK